MNPMNQKSKQKEKLEDMSNEELYKLQDGFIALRCHATKGLENIARIMHARFENQKNIMNNITICAKYKGDSTTERGFRTMLFEIPPTGGKKDYTSSNTLIPSFAAQDSCAAGRYAEGTHIIINGRVYPHAEDGKLYVVPTQPLESKNACKS